MPHFDLDLLGQSWQFYAIMPASLTTDGPPPRTPVRPTFEVTATLQRFASANWKVALYVVLIIMCVLFTPEEPLKFIYTEF